MYFFFLYYPISPFFTFSSVKNVNIMNVLPVLPKASFDPLLFLTKKNLSFQKIMEYVPKRDLNQLNSGIYF